MNYIDLESKKVVELPAIMGAYPNTSFPVPLTDIDLAPFGFAVLHPTPPPEHDPVTQGLREITPTQTDSVWAQAWEIYDLPAATIAENQAAKAASIQQDIQTSIQYRLDSFARTRGYDGILSACTYATSAVSKFKNEGQYCVDMRDATWAKSYEILSKVQAGQQTMPQGYADIEGELPALQWPA